MRENILWPVFFEYISILLWFIKELQSELYRLVCVCMHVLVIALHADSALVFGLAEVMIPEGPSTGE